MDKSDGKPVATEENQVLWEFSESETWSFHEEEVPGDPLLTEQLQGNLQQIRKLGKSQS